MTTTQPNRFAVIIDDADAVPVAEALEQRAAARLEAARIGAGQLAAEEAAGTVKDPRTGAVAVYRMLAEADQLTAVGTAIGKAQAAAQAAGWPDPTTPTVMSELVDLTAARRRITALEAEVTSLTDQLTAARVPVDPPAPIDVDELTPLARRTAAALEAAELAPAKLLAYAEANPDDLELIIAAEEAGRRRKAPLARLTDLLAARNAGTEPAGPVIVDDPALDPGEAAKLAELNANAVATAEAALDGAAAPDRPTVPGELVEELDADDTLPPEAAAAAAAAITDDAAAAAALVTSLSTDELEAIAAGDTGVNAGAGASLEDTGTVDPALIAAAEAELALRETVDADGFPK